MKKIINVIIYLDDNVPKYMSGIIRCGSIISEDEDNNEIDHQDLIDNTEFHSVEDLINYVADKLKVHKNIVQIDR